MTKFDEIIDFHGLSPYQAVGILDSLVVHYSKIKKEKKVLLIVGHGSLRREVVCYLGLIAITYKYNFRHGVINDGAIEVYFNERR